MQQAALFKSGLLLAIAGTFLFSLKPIVIKEAYQFNVDSIQLLTLRMLFALPIYLAIAISIWVKQKDNRTDFAANWWKVSLLGVLGYYLASFLDMEGLHYISAQLERIVLFCFPTLVVLISKLWFKTAMPKNIWWVLGISYGGILLIFGHDLLTVGDNVAWGTFLVFTSAVCFAFYVLFAKPLMSIVGSRFFTALAMLAASAVIFLHFSLTRSWTELILPVEVYYRVAFLAFVCTVIPSLLVAAAINKLGPERTSVVGTIGPVFTSILAVLWLDESFTPYHFIGLAMVCCAIGLMSYKK